MWSAMAWLVSKQWKRQDAILFLSSPKVGVKGLNTHPSTWVNAMLGNVKNSITGTFHSVSLKHVPRYLAEFEYRFNRRFQLDDMIERLACVGLRTPPMPYRFLRMAEIGG